MKETREFTIYDPSDPAGERVLMTVTVVVEIHSADARIDSLDVNFQHKRSEDWERHTHLEWWNLT